MVFVDTAYWIAVINPKDEWHKIALQASAKLDNIKFVTTEGVLVELLAHFSRKSPSLRPGAIKMACDLMDASDIEVIPQTHEWFLEGLELYTKRLDKEYSLQDCISMEIMRSESIQKILTSDHDFEQEGFTILMHK